MSKEFRTIEEWQAYYFPNGLPEAPVILSLQEKEHEARALLEEAAHHLEQHRLEYNHPGQPGLILKIKSFLAE